MGNKCRKIYKVVSNNEVAFFNGDQLLHNLNGPARIYFYDDDIRIKELRYLINGRYHRNEEDGPALIIFDSHGRVRTEIYYKHGIECRCFGPSYIEYDTVGNITYQEFHKS